MFRKSITQQTWCFPSFEKCLKCQEHFDPYEKQTEATQNIAKLTLSTKLEPHLQMVTWTVLLAQIQVMRQTANAYPWKIRIKKQWTIVAGNEPANPCCFEVGSFGEKDFVVHMKLQVPCVCALRLQVEIWYGDSMRSTPWTPSGELQPVNNPPKYLPVVTTTTILPRVSKRCNQNYYVNSFRFPANTSINTVTSDHSWKQTFTSRSNRPTDFSNRSIRAVLPRRSSANKLQMEGPGSLAFTKLRAPRWLICRIKMCHGLNDLHDLLCACSNF